MTASRFRWKKRRDVKAATLQAAAAKEKGDKDLPDQPGIRFLVGFFFSAPFIWLGAVGYGHSSAREGVVIALLAGAAIGGLCAIGKKVLRFFLNLLHYGGV